MPRAVVMTVSWMRFANSERQLHAAAAVPAEKRDGNKIWNHIESQMRSMAKRRWPDGQVKMNRVTGVVTVIA